MTLAQKRQAQARARQVIRPAPPPVQLSYATPPTDKGFFSLPAELRNRIGTIIYEDTMVRFRSLQVRKGQPAARNNVKPSPPPFLLVCKQTYSETVKVSTFRPYAVGQCRAALTPAQLFYATALFHFQTRRALESWIKFVQISNLSVADNVFLHSDGFNYHVLPEALEKMKRGETVLVSSTLPSRRRSKLT